MNLKNYVLVPKSEKIVFKCTTLWTLCFHIQTNRSDPRSPSHCALPCLVADPASQIQKGSETKARKRIINGLVWEGVGLQWDAVALCHNIRLPAQYLQYLQLVPIFPSIMANLMASGSSLAEFCTHHLSVFACLGFRSL